MTGRASWCLRLLFFFLLSASAGTAAERKVLVLDIGGAGVKPELARTLSDVLVNSVRDQVAGHAKVMGMEEVGSLLKVEQQKDLLGCDSSSCYAEVSGALGADRLVTGNLGKVGALYVITLRLINTAQSKVEASVSDRVEGKEDLLVEAVSQLARALLDPGRPYGQGYIQLKEPGTLAVDGRPQRAPFDKLPVPQGTHEFELKDPDGGPLWKQALEIPPYQLTLLQAPVAPPLYKRWWFWGGVVAVAGGSVAAYLATRPGPGPVSGAVAVSVHP